MDVSKLFLGKQEFTEKEPENPCEYGRRTWDMMNGNTLKQNKNLRIMCMGLMGALAVATIGNVYQATQSTVEPYIIEVDSTTGAIRKAGVISEMKYTPEKLEIEYFLGRFIQDTRSLPVDGEVYKQSWYEAYGYMTKDAAAAMSAEMDKQNKAEIVLHGVSMGAATALMAAAREDTVNLWAVVEDCGYTSAYEMFSEQLGVIFGLPSFPIMDCVDVVSGLKTGARLSEASPIEAVKHIRVPVLFIHGDADKLIPIAMMRDMYEQCPTKKKMLVVEGAGHGDAMKQDREAYWGSIFEFLSDVKTST